MLYSICRSVLILSIAATAAHADARRMVWTYEAQTMPAGEAEFESYLTLSAPDAGDLEGRTSAEHQFELEVGMTDRFDFSIYQIFEQKPSQDLRYKGYKLRFRQALGEVAGAPAVAYLEYKGVSDFSKHGVEGKLLLSREFGRLCVAVNPQIELERAAGESDWEAKLKYAGGGVYQITRLLGAGIEVRGDEDNHYAGPVVSHGTEGLWVAFGSALSLGEPTEGAADLQLRLLIGVGLTGGHKDQEAP